MDRRRYLALVGSGVTLSIAGCAGDDSDDGGDDGTDNGGSETGSDDSSNGSENGGENGRENGGENGSGNGGENGGENGSGNGGESGSGNGGESGSENGSENGSDDETSDESPPPEFEVISTTGGTYTAGESWPLEFTVANRGGRDGVFESQLQLSTSGSDWENVTEISLAVDADESERFYKLQDAVNSVGTVSFRLQGTEARWPITFEQPESEFQGPSGEDRTYVDLQYRDYLDYEVEEIKSAAGDTSYEDVLRNADDRRGDAVHFTGTIAQNIPYDTYDVYFIYTGSSRSELKPIYASYVGDNFIQGDEVELWGQILGTEIYETGAGSTNTVPGIAVAEMVLTD